MLGVGGAAAIADDQELVAGAQRRGDDGGDLARGGEQSRILGRSREPASDCSKCAAIGSLAPASDFDSWLKAHHQGLQLVSLVMIASRQRKRAILL